MKLHSIKIIFSYILFFNLNLGLSQILISKEINLNAGGQIFDVVNVPTLNCYMIVGSFTHVNGIPRNKLAFLDKTTLTVISDTWANPIVAIDGDIYTAAVYKSASLLLPPVDHFHFYIGGNFNSITIGGAAYSRNGIAKLRTNKPMLALIPGNFTMHSWNPLLNIDADPISRINDMDISGDTLFYSGDFTSLNNGVGLINERPYGVAAVDITTNTDLLMFTNLNGTYGIKNIEWHKNKLYVSGNLTDPHSTSVVRMNGDGTVDNSFLPLGWSIVGECGCQQGSGRDIEFVQDSILLYQWDTHDAYSRDATTALLNMGSGTIYSSNNSHSKQTSLATYKNYAYITRDKSEDDPLDIIKPSIYNVVFSNEPVSSASTFFDRVNSSMADFNVEHVWIVDNLLFVSDINLVEVGFHFLDQYTRIGAAVYCLEPMDAKDFIVLDTTICPEQVVMYTIPPVEYANGYIWEYTGQGVDIGSIGAENLSDTLYNVSANSVNITFLSNFTPGQLKVTPFSNFYGELVQSNAIITSNTKSINIISNPLPHVNAGLDTSLTCIRDSIVLYGYSDSAVVSHEWVYSLPGTNVIGQHDTITQIGDYVFKVVDALGCPNYDTVNVWMDDAKPTAFPPTGIYELTCLETEKTFLGSTSSPNTTEHWLDLTDTSQTPLPNPIVINVPGSYQFVVTDTINGCPKDTGIFVINNFNPPNVTVLGYPNFNVAAALDTLTCYENNLNLTCSSDTLNTTASWTSQDTSAFYGNNLDINSGGTYYIHVINNTNGCENFLPIIISEYLNVPHAHAPADNLLNCSVDSLILDGASLSAGALLEWNGGTLLSATDPLTIYDSGTYHLTVTNPDNGCISIDSVVISQDNSINVFAGDDALFCDQSLVNLTAAYAGSITGINFLWSNGSTSSNAIFTAGQNQYAAVQVFGDNGCYGVDTVFLNLPPTPVIQFESFKPCDDGASGQIVAEPLSGLEPFQYSIDQGVTYQSNSTFNGLYIGTYPIWVKDSLNCDYEFQAVIDANSSLPTPSFLFSTYNYTSDTVIVIDVSNPPTDSTIWIFSNEIIVLENNPTGPMILLPDTGVFEITMQAYYGNCLVELNKTIYASPYDSLAANQFNQNGIKSIGLYPNPNTGNFTVTVEFYKSQRASLVVQDMLGYNYVYNQYEESFVISENINLSSNAIDGTYVLKIVSEFDSAYITFIVAR